MWSFGYSDYISEEYPFDEFWGASDTFVGAVSELYDNVEKMAQDAEPYQKDYFDQALGEIRTVRDDPSFAEDPDQWEDKEFTDEIGEIVFYVMED